MEARKICQDYQETVTNDREQGKPVKTASKARPGPLAPRQRELLARGSQGWRRCRQSK